MRFLRSPQDLLSSLVAGALSATLIGVWSPAQAADPSQMYRLEVVDQPVAVGAHSEFNVSLLRTSTGEPVEDAAIIRTHLEMSMPRPPQKSPIVNPMAMKMAGEVRLLGTPSPGVYRLMGDVSMPGTWRLDIVAKVPGEADPIETTATFKADQ